MAQPKFFRLNDFSGGLNIDQHEVLLADNEATHILNFRLDKTGSLISRYGYAPVDAFAAPGPIRSIGAWHDTINPDQSVVLACVQELSGLAIYKLNPATRNYERIGAFGHTSPPRFVQSRDYLYIVGGGSSKLYRFDGTDLVELGLEAPDTAPTTTTDSGTLEAGDHSYVYTWVRDDGVESNPSPEKVHNLGGTGGVKLEHPTAPDDVTRVRWYRKSGGSVLHLFLAEVDAGDPYVDDGSVTLAAVAAPVANDPPPDIDQLAYYNGHYFGAKGRMLYWSYPLDPNYWPALNSTELAFEGHDEVVALCSYQDSLLVFGQKNILLVTGGPDGTASGTWQVIRLDTVAGASSPDAVMELMGQVIFLSYDGLRVYPGMGVFAPKLQRHLTQLPLSARQKAILTYAAGERNLWLTVDGKTYTFHLPNQAISVYDLNPVATVTGGLTGNSPPLMAIGNRLMQYGATSDDGEPITCEWRSKVFQFENPETTKFIRRIGAFASKGTGAVVTITISDQGNNYAVVLASVEDPANILWDQFSWADSEDPSPSDPRWPVEGIGYLVAALPAQTLLGQNVQVFISAQVDAPTEITPPITILYREANRFLGV